MVLTPGFASSILFGYSFNYDTETEGSRTQIKIENTLSKKILVLCTGNSCRSQIAEGYLRHFANGKAEIYSAGIETHGVNPRAGAIMKEDGRSFTQGFALSSIFTLPDAKVGM